MPHSVLLGEVFLTPAEELLISADDFRNFYDLIVGPAARAATTPVGPPFPAHLFKGWKAYGWPDQEPIHLCSPGVGMGDLNPVDVAQELHINVVRTSGGMKRESMLIYPKPVPFNNTGFFECIMIDDRVGV